MRVVFLGTPAFAVPALDALAAAGVEIAAVVTQPDRPRTRSHSTLLPPPVKLRAEALGIPVLQPERPRGEAFLAALGELAPDLGVVVAYGHILREEVLALPRLGMVNVHASLLPRWRGAAPIHWALLAGDLVTGVSIMQMEAGLDSGPVWLQRERAIDDRDTTGTLFESLASLGASALIEALPRIAGGEAPSRQDPSLVTLAPKIDRDTARVAWDRPSREVSRRIRAMDPAPGAWTMAGTEPLKLFTPSLASTDVPRAAPGTVESHAGRLCVACADGWLQVESVQPAGGRRMPGLEWLHGRGRLLGDAPRLA